MKRLENFYFAGYVKDQFIIIDMETLGEIYQDEEETNIERFTNESDETKLEHYEAFKADCIYNDCEQSWNEFYNKFKRMYDNE